MHILDRSLCMLEALLFQSVSLNEYNTLICTFLFVSNVIKSVSLNAYNRQICKYAGRILFQSLSLNEYNTYFCKYIGSNIISMCKSE